MYLFDTDIISNVLKKQPSLSLLTRLSETPPEQQYTTTITVGELVYGAYRSNRPDHFLSRLEERVWPNVKILPFDETSAHTYGKLRAELEKEGRSIGEPDLRIAALALAHNFTLITGNIKHFSHVADLRMENWLLPR